MTCSSYAARRRDVYVKSNVYNKLLQKKIDSIYTRGHEKYYKKLKETDKMCSFEIVLQTVRRIYLQMEL